MDGIWGAPQLRHDMDREWYNNWGSVTPLPKTAPLVYNIYSEHNILSSELLLPSPSPKSGLLRMRLTVPR
jgi:hypothetical protein